MRNAKCTAEHVRLDVLDAVELAEVLDYLDSWLRQASPEVDEDLVGFANDPHARRVVIEQLTAFTELLIWGHTDLPRADGDDGSERSDGPVGRPW